MMLDNLKYEVIRILSSVEIQTEEDAHVVEEQRRADQIRKMNLMHESLSENDEASETQTFRRQEKKIGRNDPCPCGSGKNIKPVMEASCESSSCYHYR